MPPLFAQYFSLDRLRQRVKLHWSPGLNNWRFWATLVLLCAAGILTWQLNSFYSQAFYPHTTINGVAVDDLTVNEAIALLEHNQPIPAPFIVEIAAGPITVASTSTELSAHYQYNSAVPSIFALAHQGSWQKQLSRFLGLSHEVYNTDIEITPLALDGLLAQVGTQFNQTGVKASVTLTTSGNVNTLVVNPGKMGQQLDLISTHQTILTEIKTLVQSGQSAITTNPPPKLIIPAVVQTTAPPLTPEQMTQTQQLAQALVGKKLQLKLQSYRFDWDDRQLVSFLLPPDQIDTAAISHQLTAINQALPNHPINAEFKYHPETLKVEQFSPGKDGLTINQAESLQAINQALNEWLHPSNATETSTESTKSTNMTREVVLSAAAQPPAITLDKTNTLGINQQIGFGESFYAHSIPGRVKNVALTAQRINLTLIKPGQEFSFNETLGEVSAATGFSPAYVIRAGRTELGDGGGVCQVSSTLFRAAMNAGLNITRRLPHSYRVSYYELNSQAGFDATVYAGNVDFRFINDTPGHLLIATETDSSKLWMKIEIYGSSDGRTATISDYKSWGATGPLPTQYIPDASLPHGQRRQIDWSAAGLKTSFVYTVLDANGTVKQKETYTSNYKPWAAKYLVGI